MNKSGFAVAALLVCVMLGSTNTIVLSLRPSENQIPTEYAGLYTTLQAALNNYSSYISNIQTSATYPVTFGAELLPANGNRGSVLLAPTTMQGVLLFLNRLQELGVQGVTIAIGYPLYTPNFPGYQDYVQFYKQVAQEIRNRGMKLDVESSVLFANSAFSSISFSYAGLTWAQFEVQRKQMIASIIKDLQPDYLNLGAEPDTQYKLTGFQEFNSPDQYAAYVNFVLDGLDRGKTLLGAGVGTWGNMQYAQTLAADTDLDFIDIHVYPIVGQASLQRIFTIAETAKQHGKRVVMDEAWLYKVATLQATSIAANTDVFRLDAFSFWAPLDQQFLALIVKSAQMENIEYVSPFWATLFFAYVDYSSDTAQLPYNELVAMVNRAATQNMISDEFSSTGLYYRQLTGARPSATSATTRVAYNSTITSNSVSTRVFPGIGIEALVGGIIAGVLTLILIRRRKARKAKSAS